MLVIGAVVVLVMLAVVIGSLFRDSGSDEGPPEGSGLLQWSPRGALVEDTSLIDSAKALWRAGSDVEQATVVVPDGDIFVLWAGEIGAGRVVIMEALAADGSPYVAQATDQGDPGVLGLDAVDPLPDDDLVALAVTYDGNLDIDGLKPGRGSALIQLLPEPTETSDSIGLWKFETTFADSGLELLETRAGGMTETFLQLDKSDPAGTPIVVASTVGASAGIAETIAVHSDRLVPTPAGIALADDPAWGPSGRIVGDEYNSLILVATKLEVPEIAGFVAASVEIEDFDLGLVASLVVLREPDGASRLACVVTDGPEREVVPDAVFVDPAEFDLDDVRVLGGSCPMILGANRRVVAVGVARPDAGEVVLEAGTGYLGGPAESLAIVLDDGPAPVGLVARLDGGDGPGSSYPVALEPR